jgi:thiamine pyrophosphokinase
MILCADGGADRALSLGVEPDFVIGDLDSLSGQARQRLQPEQLIRRPDQNSSDLEKALEFALDRKITEVTVIGVGGGRLDHQLFNLHVLERYSQVMDIRCMDSGGSGFFLRGSVQLICQPGETITLMAFRRASGITTSGLRWNVHNATFEWGVRNGLSNEAADRSVTISVKEGSLFVYRVGVWC